MNEIANQPMNAPKADAGWGDSFQEKALRLRSLRFQLLAANIANADTPNYKARDIDFKAELERSITETKIAMGNSSNNQSSIGLAASAPTILYRVPSQSSIDGNTVEMDAERAAFAQNDVMYRFTLQRVSGAYKEMSDLFKTLID